MKKFWNITFILLAVIILTSVTVFAEDVNEEVVPDSIFIYDDKGNRDPFKPLISKGGKIVSRDSDFIITDLVLEGVMMGSADNSLAILNGKVLKINDRIGNFVVGEIHTNSVVLIKGHDRFELKITKEE